MSDLWQKKIIAFAYQYQREAKPYKELIQDFASFLSLNKSEIFLDIGCGSGRIIQLVLEKSKGQVQEIWGLDHSVPALKYAKKNLKKTFPNLINRIHFLCWDISKGLPFQLENYFDLVTAGLSIQYAQHWDGQKWTKEGYKKVLRDIFSILKPGGQFVFSANTPNPDFARVAKESKREIFLSWKFPLNIIVSLIMLWQAKWLVEQAKIGRFHYLPIEEVVELLKEANFTNISYKLTYANLAWVVSCYKREIDSL